jgi:hypothetical protein
MAGRRRGLVAPNPGKLIAETPPADPGASPTPTDTSLPDPTSYAKRGLVGLIAAAFIAAVAMNALGWVQKPFTPAVGGASNFNLFAGFYVAAQVIERILELVSPLLPPWGPPSSATTAADKAAHTKADRGALTMGIGAVLGVAISAGFGLFFLRAVGITAPQTIDTFATGVTIAAGTKPLHDFISYLQNQNTPSTGSATSS